MKSGDRVVSKDLPGIFGTVVTTEAAQEAGAVFMATGYKYEFVVKVDEGLWPNEWNTSHEPYFRWGTDHSWEQIPAAAVALWFPLGADVVA